MRALSVSHDDGVQALLAALSDVSGAVRDLDDVALLGVSRCHGWSRLDLVVHVRAGLEEVLRGCLAQVDATPSHDAASYWRAYPDHGSDPVPGTLWLRRTASAYSRPTAAVRHLDQVVTATAAAVGRLPDGPLAFQGLVLSSGDFLATWAVELAVHQLDLDVPAPASSALPLVRRTLEALAGADLPQELGDEEAVLLGLGRVSAGEALPPPYPISL